MGRGEGVPADMVTAMNLNCASSRCIPPRGFP